jgi:hypothetical protein
MLTSVINALFGCAHRKTTFPLTPGRRSGYSTDSLETRAKTYVVCLDCGREFDYDWKTMKVGEPMPIVLPTTQAVSLHQ